MNKSPEAFRTISEVADALKVPPHVLRFWESRFAQVKPVKRGGGRRYYRPEDVRLLRGIRGLLYDDGITIKGVQKILRERGVRHVIDLGAPEDAEAIASLSLAPEAHLPPRTADARETADERETEDSMADEFLAEGRCPVAPEEPAAQPAPKAARADPRSTEDAPDAGVVAARRPPPEAPTDAPPASAEIRPFRPAPPRSPEPSLNLYTVAETISAVAAEAAAPWVSGPSRPLDRDALRTLVGRLEALRSAMITDADA
jgi:DNA-binding transcriptional MerR regulator